VKIDLPELERKLSYGINLTIKESTILLESMEGFIDDKIVLQEQINTAKKALTEISDGTMELSIDDFNASSKASVEAIYAEQVLAAIEKGEHNEI
jgi:hypothetical protein